MWTATASVWASRTPSDSATGRSPDGGPSHDGACLDKGSKKLTARASQTIASGLTSSSCWKRLSVRLSESLSGRRAKKSMTWRLGGSIFKV